MATTVTLKPNAIDLSGSTSGTTTLQATAVAGTTTVTLPAATDTLVGKATTDTLTNKTLTAPTLASPNITTALTLTGAAGTSGQLLTSAGSGSAPTWTTVSADTVGFKNRIINGAMVVSQRNGTSAVTIDGGASYTLDRYLCQDNTDGSYTVAQSSTAPDGFTNSLLVTITGTDSSLTTTQFGRIVQRIEGFNTADLGWGTANAKTVTLSFWVRSSVTGTFTGTFVNNDSNRIYGFTYTISSANTFEYKTITIAGDTTGTWATNNSTGIELNLSIGAGPDRSVTAGSWGTSLAYAATGQTNLFATNGATFYITGVQLEKGSTATSFDYRPYGTELALCQRYFQKSYNVDVALGTVTNAGMANTRVANTDTFIPSITQRFPVVMRTTATITWYSNSTGASGKVQSGGSDVTVSANYDVGASTTGQIQLASAPSAGGQINGHFTASAEL